LRINTLYLAPGTPRLEYGLFAMEWIPWSVQRILLAGGFARTTAHSPDTLYDTCCEGIALP
jgi:hypothetical protein